MPRTLLFAVAAVVVSALIVVLARPAGQAPLDGILLGGFISLVLLAGMLLVSTVTAGLRYMTGRDDGAGLPLAELGRDGVRVRYRPPSSREKRRGVPTSPAFDAAVGWDAVVGWRHAKDPHGQPVIALDITDPSKVTRITGQPAPGQRPVAYLDRYMDALQRTTG
ncbi:MAG TPA: hypothetical protein VK453_01820 [Micromonosporaceae bacterium]|nr:hypothetical protein [Micromonosporaceae bacterium]